MWVCPKCGKRVKDSLYLCWNCGASGGVIEDSDSQPGPDLPQESDSRRESDSQLETDVEQWLDSTRESDRPPVSDAAATWVCPGCAEVVEESFDICWNCQGSKRGEKAADLPEEFEPPSVSDSADVGSQGVPRVAFRHFRSRWESWEDLLGEAADFAGNVGPGRLISISHSSDQGDGVVTVWYWEK